MSPPPRLSRDLIIRGIAYRMQEQVRGGLSKSMSRRLRVLGADNGSIEHRPAAPITLKPGTRLVREWRGDTHSVLVRNDGYEWRGERFTSLSKIAEAITGAHWSGPRFFGLKGQAGGRSDRRPD
jgi:hypothetical protein